MSVASFGRGLALAGALCLGGPTSAQEMEFTIEPTTSCLSINTFQPRPWQACAGRAAEACMDANEGGYTTVGVVACMDLELQYWNARLNKAYAFAVDAAFRFDTQDDELGGFAPSMEEPLFDMQRAWIAYRDTRCAFERAKWGGGSGGGPAMVSCLLYETARQTALLEDGIGLELRLQHHLAPRMRRH